MQHFPRKVTLFNSEMLFVIYECCILYARTIPMFKFLQEALQKNLESGSTATVVLIVDGDILAANVGDSKALLCTEGLRHHNRKGSFFFEVVLLALVFY